MSLLDALLLDPAPFNIWLAVGTDGIKGTGTASDPFDGGTAAAFDARLKEIGALFPTEKVAIHLGPGTFYTQGYADADAANSW